MLSFLKRKRINMYHYTYLLQHKTTNYRYIGVRSSSVPPLEDNFYYGSSKHIPKDVKETHRKIILKVFNTREDAVAHEILLHKLNNVATDPTYYNKACQTSTKFDTSGVPNPHSDDTRRKLSIANTGKKRTEKQRIAQSIRQKGRKLSLEAVKKKAESIKKNKSNAGSRNSQFKPWFIMTETVTHLFCNVSKNEQSLADGHYKKFYADLQKKYNRTKQPLQTKTFGKIHIGDLPKQYKI